MDFGLTPAIVKPRSSDQVPFPAALGQRVRPLQPGSAEMELRHSVPPGRTS